MQLPRHYARIHLLLIPGLLALAALLSHFSPLDRWFTQLFYRTANAGFPAHEWPWLELFGHHLAKNAVTLIWLSLLACVSLSRFWPHAQPQWRQQRPAFWAALAGMALGPLLVVALKELNGYHCPWDLAEFGGAAEFTGGWFVARSQVGHCFPGGHAASGFSLISLYFLALAMEARQARRWLWLTLVVGSLFSLIRIMQGAHFLSHNLWAAAICWLMAALCFQLVAMARQPGRTRRLALASVAACRPLGALGRRVASRLPQLQTLARHLQRGSPLALHEETLLLLTVLMLMLLANSAFWQGLLAGRSLFDAATWRFLLTSFIALSAVHFALLALLALLITLGTGRLLRPVLSLLVAISLLAGHYSRRYGVVIDPAMLHNVLQTDWKEARELLSPDLFWPLLLALSAVGFIWRVRLIQRPRRQAWLVRSGSLALALVIGSAALLGCFQDFGSAMRTHKALRYQLAPGNVLWSLSRIVIGSATAQPAAPLETVTRQPPATARKPLLLVLVVGETARAANFGLNGYARMTTPQLAGLDVINFPHVTACGTSTAVSLPCMFSPYGRADYDEAKIRQHESLLQLLARAGLTVSWLDNQSGCKGVCDGLEFVDLGDRRNAGLCGGERCYDEILVQALQERLQPEKSGTDTHSPAKDQLVVLHQLGNHGPAYYRRYPRAFARYSPACAHDDLGQCSRQEIVNAYDNALLYTDHVLARLIDLLKTQAAEREVALLYLSDHGESLGEYGLFLHGMPQAIAPREQLDVPMLWWLPETTANALQIDRQCLQAQASQPYSHDNLYSSLLGLLQVNAPSYQAERDLFKSCRNSK